MTEESPLTEESDTPDRRVTQPLTVVSPKQGIEQGKNKEKAKPSVPPCPHSEIIDLYHDTLPELPNVIKSRWSGSTRAKNLVARWREDKRHQDLEFWKWLFESMKGNGFWLGENGRGWRADLGWIVKRENFDKILQQAVNQQDKRRAAS